MYIKPEANHPWIPGQHTPCMLPIVAGNQKGLITNQEIAESNKNVVRSSPCTCSEIMHWTTIQYSQ